MDRRTFMTAAAGVAGATLVPQTASGAPGIETRGAAKVAAVEPHLTWSIFSRHLQFLTTQAFAASNPKDTGLLIGQAAAEMGFAAVDLTVRPGGHVEPSLVKQNLPIMVDAIRSTGVICDHITTNIVPNRDPSDETWIDSQFVNDILSTAKSVGIKRFRWGSISYNTNVNPPLFGDTMLDQLDDMKVNVRRLAKIVGDFPIADTPAALLHAAQFGKVHDGIYGIYHTFNNAVGTAIWDLLSVLDGIDPSLLGINYAVGHIVTDGPQSVWSINLRAGMKYIRGLALQDVIWQKNANGTWSSPTVQAGTGMINWKTFFQLLLQGGYNGPSDLQIEYTIVGAKGTSVSLNQTFWADNSQFTSGNLTRPIMLATMKSEVDYYKTQALAAGWTATQMT